MPPKPAFTFIDLFAGIGGFHAALAGMGGRCVYAVEIDEAASAVYDLNWHQSSLGDITNDANDEVVTIPAHDVLVAGFPCQPFSKSGYQMGMEETRGTLYYNILKIIEARKPHVVLLENVRNLAGPRHRHEWEVIVATLRSAGYRVSREPAILSPHKLPPNMGGRPHARERVFISATYAPESSQDEVDPISTSRTDFGWDPNNWDLLRDLPIDQDLNSPQLKLTKQEVHWINAWDEFVRLFRRHNRGDSLPGFPIWADNWVLDTSLRVSADTPSWKADFLRKNAALYTANRNWIDPWTEKWGVYSEQFPTSRRKFEWQAQDAKRLWDTVMHFRPSGIRAKRLTYVPALVAITQTSIIGPLKRRISPREAARLQGVPDWFEFGDQRDALTYKQLGNGVCVGVVWNAMKLHVERDRDLLAQAAPALVSAVTEAPSNPDEALALLSQRSH